MQDEKFDILIKRAANGIQSSYNKDDWDSMLSLLDKHLPQKSNGKKRILLLLLAFIVITSTSIFIYKNQQLATKHNNISVNTVDKKIENNLYSAIDKDLQSNNLATSITTTQLVNNNNDNSSTTPTINKLQAPFNYNIASTAKVKITSGIATSDADEIENILTENINTLNTVANIETKTEEQKTTTLATETKETKTDKKATEETAATENKRKKQNKALQKLSLNFSLGPDISFVTKGRPLSAGILVGGGVSYAVSKNISFQTGVYLSNKIYNADSASYHPPTSFWGAYSNLQNVNGACLVYEFPISATYNFLHKGKNNLFASAGVSSYLVKRETYTYSYKNSLGQPDKRNYTLKEKDRYNFSVLTLSAGLRTQPDKRVSYKVEPFIKMPLSGIGFGKIDLKSTGVMFSIAVKPFVKRR